MKKLPFKLSLFFCGIFLLFFPHLCIQGARDGLLLWSGTIVPTLLPFFLLTGLMNKYDALSLVSIFFYPVYKKFSKLNPDLASTLVLGFVCGCPLGAKIVSDLVLCGSYTKKEGQCLLVVCNNISPMFTVGYTLYLILHDQTNPFPFFFCLYLPNIIYFLYYIFRFYKKDFFCCHHKEKNSFFSAKSLDHIIFDSLHSIFMIGIYIMIFSIGSQLLASLPSIPIITNGLKSCMEITTGLSFLSSMEIKLSIKAAFACMISSIGGLCGIAQTADIIKESRLSIHSYIIWKFIFSICSFFLGLLIL